MKTKYVIEVIDEDHPMCGDYRYDVRKLHGSWYAGEGRFCRDAEEVLQYLLEEERKRES